jgi:hypothetical protein
MERHCSGNEDGITMPVCDYAEVLICIFMSSYFLPKLCVCVYYVRMHV